MALGDHVKLVGEKAGQGRTTIFQEVGKRAAKALVLVVIEPVHALYGEGVCVENRVLDDVGDVLGVVGDDDFQRLVAREFREQGPPIENECGMIEVLQVGFDQDQVMAAGPVGEFGNVMREADAEDDQKV